MKTTLTRAHAEKHRENAEENVHLAKQTATEHGRNLKKSAEQQRWETREITKK